VWKFPSGCFYASQNQMERIDEMKERLLDVGSYLLAAVLSVTALAAVAELSVNGSLAGQDIENCEGVCNE
jgi:hypothetical protein